MMPTYDFSGAYWYFNTFLPRGFLKKDSFIGATSFLSSFSLRRETFKKYKLCWLGKNFLKIAQIVYFFTHRYRPEAEFMNV
jgi:hypothetical protein